MVEGIAESISMIAVCALVLQTAVVVSCYYSLETAGVELYVSGAVNEHLLDFC